MGIVEFLYNNILFEFMNYVLEMIVEIIGELRCIILYGE